MGKSPRAALLRDLRRQQGWEVWVLELRRMEKIAEGRALSVDRSLPEGQFKAEVLEARSESATWARTQRLVDELIDRFEAEEK